MSTLPLGTTKNIFGNTFIYVDPQYVNGLGLWRVYPGIPEPSDVTGLAGILPIVVEDTSATSIKVKFDIEDLPDITATVNTSAFTAAHGLMQSATLPGMAPAGQTILTIAPVQHVRAQSKAVLYFDIKSLKEAEIVGFGAGYVDTRPEKYKVTVKDYNKSNGVNIDSEAPMVDEVIGSTGDRDWETNNLCFF